MDKDISSVEKDFGFQKSEWPVQRIGWALMALFLLLGLIGLFGTGYISKQREEGKNFSVEYQKYLRYSMSQEIVIELKNGLRDSSISINSDYLKKIKIEKITPEPESVKGTGDKLQVKFSAGNIKKVTIYTEPIKSGKQALMTEVNGEKIDLNQLIYF